MSVVILLKEGKRAGLARPAVFDITYVCVCEAVQGVRSKALPPNKAALLLPVGNVMLQSIGVCFFVWAYLPGKQ